MVYTVCYDSPLGRIVLAAEENLLTGLWFEGQKYFGSTLSQPAQFGGAPILEEAKLWLDQYFLGRQPETFTKILLKGTPFQQRVWAALQQIPYGETVTYGQLAKILGKPQAAQAVGGAVGRNPVSIMIPCHRVVGTGGALTGYAGGKDRKQWLLEWENYGDR